MFYFLQVSEWLNDGLWEIMHLAVLDLTVLDGRV